MITTKNLCLVEISFIKKMDWYGIGKSTQYLDKEKRYTLAKKNGFEYVDVFTNTIYMKSSDVFSEGVECVTSSRNIISSRKFITKNEAIYILQNLNPNYLPKKVKTLKKVKNK